MTHPARLVEVVRSGLVESVHRGSVAVADPTGALLAWAGDPEHRSFARSCTKPLQAAVSLSLVGEEDLTDPEIALMCGSHNGEPVHVEGVASILRRAGLGFEALRCPPAWPFLADDARAVPGQDPRFHNCSGKHAGMVLACVRQGWDVDTYPDPEHPLQARVLDAVREWAGEEPQIGVDGCGIPVHALSLRGLATLYARLAQPAPGPLASQAARAVAAMRAEPQMVCGRETFDTDAMDAIPDLVTKVGAEGLQAAALIGDGVGVVVGIDDGGSRAGAPAMLHAVRALGVVDDAAVERLARWAAPPVLGGGRAVGSLVARFELERP